MFPSYVYVLTLGIVNGTWEYLSIEILTKKLFYESLKLDITKRKLNSGWYENLVGERSCSGLKYNLSGSQLIGNLDAASWSWSWRGYLVIQVPFYKNKDKDYLVNLALSPDEHEKWK